MHSQDYEKYGILKDCLKARLADFIDKIELPDYDQCEEVFIEIVCQSTKNELDEIMEEIYQIDEITLTV